MKNTYVYLIKEKLGQNAPVKIGVARNPEERLGNLQVGNSRTLILAAKIGPISEMRAYNMESGLHKKFRKFHIRGEWFSGVILSKLRETRDEYYEEQFFNEELT